MGKFLVSVASTAVVGALALAAFFYAFPHPDKQTVAIALGCICVAAAPIAWNLWRDLDKTYIPPKE
jgi:hypothetical protein